MDNSIESIRVRERIIREFYHEWKERNQGRHQESQRRQQKPEAVWIDDDYGLRSCVHRKGEDDCRHPSTHQGEGTILHHGHQQWIIKKAPSQDALMFAPEAWRRFTLSVMLCWRGLRTTHIHRPFTTYSAAKVAKYLIRSKYLSTKIENINRKDSKNIHSIQIIDWLESNDKSNRVKVLGYFAR